MRKLDTLIDRFEQASLKYAALNGIERGPDWFVLKMQEELGELTQAYMKLSGGGRTHGRAPSELRQALANETADLFGHLLLFVGQNDIDLASAIERKWRFRP